MSAPPAGKPTDVTVAGALSRQQVEIQKAKKSTVHLEVMRGAAGAQRYQGFDVEVEEGMVVLDAVHRVQAAEDPTLACRWNCKAGKCGSCSAEINGMPRLMCMTRLDDLPPGPIHVRPVQTFPVVKDLVTDVAWNFEKNRQIAPFTPKAMTEEEKRHGEFRMTQEDVDRVQEFRKCIECFLCQDVCHVLRDHEHKDAFFGPRFMIRIASLEMHPKDAADRVPLLKTAAGVGYCNITKCCTEVCPEHIRITDNGIIPMKERVVDRYYDPVMMLWNKVRGKR